VSPPGKEVGLVLGKHLSIAGVKGELSGDKIKFVNGAVWVKQHATTSVKQPSITVKPTTTPTTTPPTTTTPTTTKTTTKARVTTTSTRMVAAASTTTPKPSTSSTRSSPCQVVATRSGTAPCAPAEVSATTAAFANAALVAASTTMVAPCAPVASIVANTVPVTVTMSTTTLGLFKPYWWAVPAGIAVAGAGALAGGVAAGVVESENRHHPKSVEHVVHSRKAQEGSIRFMSMRGVAERAKVPLHQQRSMEPARPSLFATASPSVLLAALGGLCCLFILAGVVGFAFVRSRTSSTRSLALLDAEGSDLSEAESEDLVE
jgi:hypothetical protein